MIDFSKITGWSDQRGVITQVADASGRVMWALPQTDDGDTSVPMTFEAKLYTSSTYAGGTSYSDDKFILLDIYPKRNGTVNVTYGGLTKTITDKSGVMEPNAQQVWFGTFNGVSDEVEMPESGVLTIDGYFRGVGQGSFISNSKSESKWCECIDPPTDWGSVKVIPDSAFTKTLDMANAANWSYYFPEGLISIGTNAFSGRTSAGRIHIPSSVVYIGDKPWTAQYGDRMITVDSNNKYFTLDQKCLIEISASRVIYAPRATGIPDYVTNIDANAFANCTLTEVTIPAGVTDIGMYAFNSCSKLTSVIFLSENPPTVGSSIFNECTALTTITVPVGCGEVYKTDAGLSEYADIIVEAS